MASKPSSHLILAFAVSVSMLLPFRAVGALTPEQEARRILEASGIKGGLIVHVGCGDGKLTAALCANDAFTVHALDRDAENVARARAYLRRKGLYGRASVDRLEGDRLPYIENLANLVVVEDYDDPIRPDVIRVLAPQGVACYDRGNGYITTAKPRPQEIDEWTHYLYDATNNAVSKDKAIGPLRRLQWQGGPRWSRHHDHMSSLSSVVSAGGRLFYILDEGSTASILLPSRWFLTARDAFNGCILWKRPIEKWHTQLWPLKSGPALLTRRLVAVGDTVYVTMGIDAPLSALDAVTGETLHTYEGTRATEEVLVSDGTLFLVTNPDPEATWHDYPSIQEIKHSVRDPKWSGDKKVVMAVRADDGQILWQDESFVSPGTLAVDGRRAYFHDGGKIVAIDRVTGERAWTSQSLPTWQNMHSFFVPCLVAYDGVVLWAGGEQMVPHRGGKDAMVALSAETGRTLWTAPHAASGYQSAEDLLVAGGLVWTGATTGGGYDGIFRGYDPHTGELKKEFPPDVEPYWFHHRCYRGKATEDYLLMSRTGIEYLDIDKETWTLHHWVRGACLTGVTPCNGMIYATPHDCACYPEAKVYGFAALAAASEEVDVMRAPRDAARLEKGPAFGRVSAGESPPRRTADWPTYRGDASRNGYTNARVASELTTAWARQVGGKLSSVTIANGKLFVASVDDHTVHALDAGTGDAVWQFTAGGRVDSPPTIWRGLCLFGSTDGYAYCLRASDGQLVWRFLAAPVDQRHMVFGQPESVWPCHGSILVQDGVAYVVAGRSMFLDGGLHLYRLDPQTGRMLTHKHFDDVDPETGENLQMRHEVLQMPVALSDILSSDGQRVFMRSQVFDLEGNRTELGPHSGDLVLQATVQRGPQAHLFAPYGFLDGSWFHRSYWVYGRSFSGSHGGYYQAGRFAPYGRILTADEKNVYGYARQPEYLRWTTPLEYHLFASDKEAPELPDIADWRKSRNSWISVENSQSLDPTGKPLVVEAWIESEKPNGVVVARGGPAQGYTLYLKGGRPHFAVRVNSEVHDVGARQRVVGAWTHLAGVLTADEELAVYVNGELAATGRSEGLIASEPSQAMEIGADDGGAVADYTSPYAFTGLIDEVRVYFGNVSPAEIARHFESPTDTTARDAELVLRYSFENGKARDLSGHDNNGKLQGVRPMRGRLGTAMQFTGRADSTKRHYVEYHWSVENPPVVARAMVLADDTLFIAGPPDVVDEDEVTADLTNRNLQQKLLLQEAALNGERGGVLVAVSKTDGRTLARRELDAMPEWDAMAAAQGRLYLSTTDGRVLCLAPDDRPVGK